MTRGAMGAAAPAAIACQPGSEGKKFQYQIDCYSFATSSLFGLRGEQQITSEGQDEGLLNEGQGMRANIRVAVVYSLLQKVK